MTPRCWCCLPVPPNATRSAGLTGGADDYLTKPFSRVELLARLQVLRRRLPTQPDPETVFDDGVIHLDFALCQLTVQGKTVPLTPTEYRLLSALVQHAGTGPVGRAADRAGVGGPQQACPRTGSSTRCCGCGAS